METFEVTVKLQDKKEFKFMVSDISSVRKDLENGMNNGELTKEACIKVLSELKKHFMKMKYNDLVRGITKLEKDFMKK